MHSICLSVRPFVRALTVVNILQMSLNLYMLFILDIEWRVLKMICMGLSVRLQRHIKVSDIHWPIGSGGSGLKFL